MCAASSLPSTSIPDPPTVGSCAAAQALAGQFALVTGGAVRIGRAICEALAKAGATVVIHHRRSVGPAQQLCAALQAATGAAHRTISADLADPTQVAMLIERTLQQNGRLDILVNNAAIFEPRPISSTDVEMLTEHFQTNLFAPFLLLRDFARLVGRGQVVNLLDRRIRTAGVGSVGYMLTKVALATLTEAAAIEFAPDIRVNGVAPGVVLPPPGVAAIGPERLRRVPLGRAVTPAEVASCVLFVLTNAALSGQILYAAGGEQVFA